MTEIKPSLESTVRGRLGRYRDDLETDKEVIQEGFQMPTAQELSGRLTDNEAADKINNYAVKRTPIKTSRAIGKTISEVLAER